MTNEATNALDLHQVLLEIEEEVRSKRASGELGADVEKELDLVFARFAPPGAVEGDFDALLQRAEQQSFIDLLAPNESVRPGVPQVKRVVQKTVRWYLRYIAEQIGGFSHTITKAVRILGDRVQFLEQAGPPSDGADAVLRALHGELSSWLPTVTRVFENADGRVLHARCGTGEAVGALRAAGVDAYGVDAASDFVAVGTAAGLDLRPDDERSHLHTLAPGVLGGLLLSGVTDVLPRGAQIELADLAALVLKHDAALVLLVTNPLRWDTLDGVPTDLAPGRPMRAESWKHLLHERGFSDIEIHERTGDGLIAVPGTDEAAAAMNANIEKLNALLYPTRNFLITAKR